MPGPTGREQLLYTARTETTGEREGGVSRSADGRLDIVLSAPGTACIGTNPEQLLAAGWSACFKRALGVVAGARNIALPHPITIVAEVDLNRAGGDYFHRVRLSVSMPGVARDVAQALVQEAHRVCLYSKATRGNVDVAIDVT